MALLRTLTLSLAFAAGGAAAFACASDGLRAFTTESARRLAVQRAPPLLPALALQTQSGARIDLAELRGHWLLIDFMYTRCASVCSAQGAEFAQLQRRLAGPIASGRLQLMSLSFDPAHDAPRELAAWLRRAHAASSGWVAARPLDAASLARMKRDFGLTVVADGAGGFVHNVAVHLVDPQGRLVEVVDPGAAEDAARRALRQGS
jgi:protein SCO1/2